MEDINKDPMLPENQGEQNPVPKKKLSQSPEAVKARNILAQSNRNQLLNDLQPDIWGGKTGQQGGVGVNYKKYAGGKYAKAAERGNWSKTVTPNFDAAVRAFEENTFFDVAKDATIGGLKNVGAGILDQIGSMDIADVSAMAMGEKVNMEGNYFQQLAKSIKDNLQEENQIYTKDTGSLVTDMMNGSYWASQVQNMGYTVGIMIPTIAEQIALSAVTAETGGAGGIVQAGRLANTMARIRTGGQVILGASSGIREAYVNARETMENVYQDYSNREGYTKEQAENIAQRAATLAFRTEVVPIMTLNVLQNLALFGGMAKSWGKSSTANAQVFNKSAGKSMSFGVSDAAESLMEKMFPHIENKWGKRALKYGVMGGGSEAIEEGYQTFAGSMGTYLEEKERLGDKANFHLDGAEMRDSMVGGFLGGILLGAGGKLVGKWTTSKEAKAAEKNYQQFLEDTVDRNSKTLNNVLNLQTQVKSKKEEISGLLRDSGKVDHRSIPKNIKKSIDEYQNLQQKLAEETQRLNVINTAASLHMDYMKGDGNMSAYNSHIGSMQEILDAIDNKDVEKLQQFKLLDEKGQETTPGSLKDFRDNVQDSLDISYKYKDHLETQLDQTTSDFNIAHSFAQRHLFNELGQEDIDSRVQAAEDLYNRNNRFAKMTKKGQLKFKQQTELQSLNNVPVAKQTPTQKERIKELTNILKEVDPEFSKADERQLRQMSKGNETLTYVNALTDIETRKAILNENEEKLEEDKKSENILKMFNKNLYDDVNSALDDNTLKYLENKAKNNNVYTADFENLVESRRRFLLSQEEKTESTEEDKSKSKVKEETQQRKREAQEAQDKLEEKKAQDIENSLNNTPTVEENSENSDNAKQALETIDNIPTPEVNEDNSTGGEKNKVVSTEGFKGKSREDIINSLVEQGANFKMAEIIADKFLSDNPSNPEVREQAPQLDLNNIPNSLVQTTGNGEYHIKHEGKIIKVIPKDSSKTVFKVETKEDKQKPTVPDTQKTEGYYEGWEDSLDDMDKTMFDGMVLQGYSNEEAYEAISSISFGDGEETLGAPKQFDVKALDKNKENITRAFESVLEEIKQDLDRQPTFYDLVSKMIKNTTRENADNKFLMFSKIWQDYLNQGKLSTTDLNDVYNRLFNSYQYASSLLDDLILDEEVNTFNENKPDENIQANTAAKEKQVETKTNYEADSRTLEDLQSELDDNFILDPDGNFTPKFIDRDTRRTNKNPMLAYSVSPYVEMKDQNGVTRKVNATEDLVGATSIDSPFSPLSMVEMQVGDTLGFEIEQNLDAIVTLYTSREDDNGFVISEKKEKISFRDYLKRFGAAEFNADGSIKTITRPEIYNNKVPIKVLNSNGSVGYLNDADFFRESNFNGSNDDIMQAFNNNQALRNGLINGDFDSLQISSKTFGSAFLLSKTAGIESTDALRPIEDNLQGYTNQSLLAVGIPEAGTGKVNLLDHSKKDGLKLNSKEDSGIELVNVLEFESGAIYDLRQVGFNSENQPLYFASKAYSNNPSKGESLDPRVVKNLYSVFQAAYIISNKDNTSTIGRDNPKLIKSILNLKYQPKDDEGNLISINMLEKAEAIRDYILENEHIDINSVEGFRKYLSKYINIYSNSSVETQEDVAGVIEDFLDNSFIPNGTPILVMSKFGDIYYAIKGDENNGGFEKKIGNEQTEVNYKYFPSPISSKTFNTYSFKFFGDFMDRMFEGDVPAVENMMFSPSPTIMNSAESRENPVFMAGDNLSIDEEANTSYDKLVKQILKNDVKSFEIETQAGTELISDVQPMIALEGKKANSQEIGKEESSRVNNNSLKTEKKGKSLEVEKTTLKSPTKEKKVQEKIKKAKEQKEKVEIITKEEVKEGQVEVRADIVNTTTGESIEENAIVIRNLETKDKATKASESVKSFVNSLENNSELKNLIMDGDFNSIIGEDFSFDGLDNLGAPLMFNPDDIEAFSNLYTNKITSLTPEEQSQFTDYLFNNTATTIALSGKKVNLKQVLYEVNKSVDRSIDEKLNKYNKISEELNKYIQAKPEDSGAIIYSNKLESRIARLKQVKKEKDKLISDGSEHNGVKGKLFVKFERLFNEKLTDVELTQDDITAFDALQDENNPDNVDDGAIDESWSSSAYEKNVKVSFSKELKIFFTGVQKYDADNTPIFNSLGFPIYYSMEDALTMLQEITTSIKSDEDTLFEALRDKAEKVIEGTSITEQAAYKQIYEKIAGIMGRRTTRTKDFTNEQIEQAKDEKLVNEILYKLIQNRLSMDMIIYSADENSGTYSLSKINANSRDVIDSLYTQWKTNFRNSKLVTTEAGEVIYDVENLQTMHSRINLLTEQVKKKSITPDEARRHFVDILNDLGVTLSSGTIDKLLTNNKSNYFRSLQNILGRQGLLGKFKTETLPLTKANIAESKLVIKNDKSLPHYAMSKMFKELAKREKDTQGASISRSFRIEGKVIQGTIQDMMAYTELEKLIGDSETSKEHRDFLARIPLTEKNALLNLIMRAKSVREGMKISHVSLRAIKKIEKKISDNNGKFATLPLTDSILAELGFFMNNTRELSKELRYLEDSKDTPNNIKLRMADLMFPTLSDKDAMIKMTTVVMDLKASKDGKSNTANLIYNENNLTKDFVIHDKVLEVLSETFFKSELRRAIQFRKAEGKINIKATESAGKVFISMPLLNRMAYKNPVSKANVFIHDYIDTLVNDNPNLPISEIESKVLEIFGDKAKDIISNTIHKDVEDKIKINIGAVVEDKNIYSFAGEWADNGFIESQFDNISDTSDTIIGKNMVKAHHLDTNFLLDKIDRPDAKTQITAEDNIASIKASAYDFVINNLMNQANVYQLIAGDIALYAKSSFEKFVDKKIKSNGDAEFTVKATGEKLSYKSELKRYNDIINKSNSNEAIQEAKANIKELRNKFLRSQYGEQTYIEYSIEVGENATKRNAMNIAPGNLIANSDGERYLQVLVDDPVSHSSVINNIIRAAYLDMSKEQLDGLSKVDELKELSSKLDEASSKFYVKESKDLANTISELKDQIESLRDELGNLYPKVSGYFQMEGADAQEYTTWQEFVDVIYRQGRMSSKQIADINDIQKTLESGKDLSQKQVDLLITLNPQKPVYAGKTSMELDGVPFMDRTVYVKSSAFPLLPQLTRDYPEMDNLRKNLEKLITMDLGDGNTNYRGVRLSYQTANKIGSVSQAIDVTRLYNEDVDLKSLLGFDGTTNTPKSAIFLDRNNFRIQQDTPSKTDKYLSMDKDDIVTMGSQFWKIAMGGGVNMESRRIFKNVFSPSSLKLVRKSLADELEDYDPVTQTGNLKNKEGELIELRFPENEPLNGAELDFIKYLAEKRLFENNRLELANDLGVNPNTLLPYDVKETTKRLQKILVDEVTVRDYPVNILNELGLKVTKNGNLEFNNPLWMSNSTDKFEALLNSVVTNRLIKLKLPGNQHISTSSQGFSKNSVLSENKLDDKTRSRVVHIDPLRPDGPLRGTYVEEIMNEKGEITELTHPSEILIKSHFRSTVKDENGNIITKLIDLNDDKYYYEINGVKYLNLEMVDPQLLENFTFRIPTSAHQSGALVKVVGFLPPESGDMIVVPAEHTQQIGEDYDIDKRFVYKYHYTISEEGRISKLTQENIEDIQTDINYQREYLETDFGMLINGLVGELELENASPVMNYIRHKIEAESLKDLLNFYKTNRPDKYEITLEIQERLQEVINTMESDPEAFRGSLHDSTIEKFYSGQGSYENERLQSLRNNLLKHVEGKLLKKISKKVIENDIIDSYVSLFGSSDKAMQAKISEILSFDVASVSANLVDKTIREKAKESLVSNKKGFSIFSDSFQRAQRILGADGKIGIGAHSNAVTMQAIMERVRNEIRVKQLVPVEGTEELTAVDFVLNIGGMFSDSRIGLTNTINSSRVPVDNRRTVAAVHAENQNSSTDNVKAQIMGKRNENKYTISVLVQMTYRGFDQTYLEDKKMSVHMPTLFLAQPSLRKYTELKESSNSLTNDLFLSDSQIYLSIFRELATNTEAINNLAKSFEIYDFDPKDQNAIENLYNKLKDEVKYGTPMGLEFTSELTGDVLFDNLENEPTVRNQVAVLILFDILKDEATKLAKYQSMLNVSTSGMGISYFETLRRIEDLIDFANDTKFEGLHGIVGTIYTSNREDLEKFYKLPEDKRAEYQMFVSPKDPSSYIFVRPNTSEGIMLINSLKMTMASVGQVYPYQNSLIKSTINNIINIMEEEEGSEISKSRQVKVSYDVTNFIRDYIYSGERVGLFTGNSNEERQRLFMDDVKTGKESLPAYMQKLAQNFEHPLFRNNLLLRDFDYSGVNIKDATKPSILKFLDNSGDSFDKSDRYTAFLELLTDNKTQLPVFNGEIMTPLKLARDLASYAYLGNQEGGAIGFRSFVHQDYLETIGFSAKLREINQELKKNDFTTLLGQDTSVDDVRRSIVSQYMQHNPDNFNKVVNRYRGRMTNAIKTLYTDMGADVFTPMPGVTRENLVKHLNDLINVKKGDNVAEVAQLKKTIDLISTIDYESYEKSLADSSESLFSNFPSADEVPLLVFKTIVKRNSILKPYALFKMNEEEGILERVPVLGTLGFNETRAEKGLDINESILQSRLNTNLSNVLSMRRLNRAYRLSLEKNTDIENIDQVSDLFIKETNDLTSNDLNDLIVKLVNRNQKITDDSGNERYLFDFNHARLAEKFIDLNNTLKNNVDVLVGSIQDLEENVLTEYWEGTKYNHRGYFFSGYKTSSGKPMIFIDNDLLKKATSAKNAGLLAQGVESKEPIQFLVETLIEENIHASLDFIVTKYQVPGKHLVKSNAPIAVQRLFTLFNMARTNEEIQDYVASNPTSITAYRLKNIQEFIAGVLIDKEFRDKMDSFYPDVSQEKNLTLLEKVFQAIKNIFSNFLGVSFSDATIKSIEDTIALESAEAKSKEYYDLSVQSGVNEELLPHKGWSAIKPDPEFTPYETFEVSNSENADMQLDDELAKFSNGKSIQELIGDLNYDLNDEGNYNYYLKLWKLYFLQHPYKLMKIKNEASNKIITKQDLRYNLNPARAISDILGETNLTLSTLDSLDTAIRRDLNIEDNVEFELANFKEKSNTAEKYLKNVRPVNMLDLRSSDTLDVVRKSLIIREFFKEPNEQGHRPFVIKTPSNGTLRPGEQKMLKALRELMEEKYGYSEMVYTEEELKKDGLIDYVTSIVGEGNLDSVFMLNPNKDPKLIAAKIRGKQIAKGIIPSDIVKKKTKTTKKATTNKKTKVVPKELETKEPTEVVSEVAPEVENTPIDLNDPFAGFDMSGDESESLGAPKLLVDADKLSLALSSIKRLPEIKNCK